jgi:probable rRNA maturation factor
MAPRDIGPGAGEHRSTEHGIEVEVANRSGVDVDADAAVALARRVLAGEDVLEGELGLAFVPPEEIRALKAEHLGIDEVTDALAFPIDGLDELPEGLPRQLGDVVVCPQFVGEAWRAPLVHAVLHLLGHDHGDAMAAREAVYAE